MPREYNVDKVRWIVCGKGNKMKMYSFELLSIINERTLEKLKMVTLTLYLVKF